MEVDTQPEERQHNIWYDIIFVPGDTRPMIKRKSPKQFTLGQYLCQVELNRTSGSGRLEVFLSCTDPLNTCLGALAEFRISIEARDSENDEIIQMFDSWTDNMCVFYFTNNSQKVCSILTTALEETVLSACQTGRCKLRINVTTGRPIFLRFDLPYHQITLPDMDKVEESEENKKAPVEKLLTAMITPSFIVNAEYENPILRQLNQNLLGGAPAVESVDVGNLKEAFYYQQSQKHDGFSYPLSQYPKFVGYSPLTDKVYLSTLSFRRMVTGKSELVIIYGNNILPAGWKGTFIEQVPSGAPIVSHMTDHGSQIGLIFADRTYILRYSQYTPYRYWLCLVSVLIDGCQFELCQELSFPDNFLLLGLGHKKELGWLAYGYECALGVSPQMNISRLKIRQNDLYQRKTDVENDLKQRPILSLGLVQRLRLLEQEYDTVTTEIERLQNDFGDSPANLKCYKLTGPNPELITEKPVQNCNVLAHCISTEKLYCWVKFRNDGNIFAQDFCLFVFNFDSGLWKSLYSDGFRPKLNDDTGTFFMQVNKSSKNELNLLQIYHDGYYCLIFKLICDKDTYNIIPQAQMLHWHSIENHSFHFNQNELMIMCGENTLVTRFLQPPTLKKLATLALQGPHGMDAGWSEEEIERASQMTQLTSFLQNKEDQEMESE